MNEIVEIDKYAHFINEKSIASENVKLFIFEIILHTVCSQNA